MLLVLDISFSSLVLAVCTVCFSLIGYMIRSQWRRSTARKDEIKRLMFLAALEASRAELEASVNYSYSVSSSVSVPQSPQCAVCLFPTTRRCSHCKAVLYCSSKCQITHWRKGHKDECHPLAEKSYTDLKAKKDGQNDNFSNALENEGTKHPAPASMSHCETMRTDPDCFAEASLPNHSEIEGDINAKRSFESSDARFSGFTDPAINESSDNGSLRRSVGSDDTENHLLKTRSVTENVKQCEELSPKFASLADSLDSRLSSCHSGLNGLSRQTSVNSNERAYGESTKTSSQGSGCLNDSSIVEPSAASLKFWESALGPTKMTSRHHSSVLPGPKSREIVVEKVEKSGTINSLPLKCRKSAGKSPDSSPSDSTIQTFGQARSQVIKDAVLSSNPKMVSLRGDSSDTQSTSLSDFHSISRVLHTSIRSNRACETKPALAPLSQQALSTSSIAKNCLNSAGRVAAQLKRPVMSRQCSLRSSDLGGRYNEGLFPYDVFIKLYTWKEVELHPCGLINCGNSCYANAVLQCLAFTPPLTAFFLQGLHSKACRENDWCFMCDFEALILKAKQSESPVSPINIVSQLKNIGSQLSSGRQEDAHEFLRCTIDAMERTCLKESGVMPDSSEADTTLMGLTFGGYLQSKIRCCKCQCKFERHERMMDLIVEVEGDIKTLEEALLRFTQYETLDGENKYKCSRCGSYEKAKKKLTVLEAPNILTITLKLYQFGKLGKINKSIKFPEILNLAPYMSGTSDKSPIYRLYGVIIHLDIMNAAFSGHYICYVKNPQHRWFMIDDSKVTPVDKETVFAAEAYMLLYSRCSSRSPRSIRNKIISSNPTLTISKLAASSFYRPSIHRSMKPPLDSNYHHHLKPVPEEDSALWSDNSSIFSSNSDEGSTSTDGTCSDDLSEHFLGQNLGRPWRESPISEAASSSPPLFVRTGVEAIPLSHFDTTKPNAKLVHSSSNSNKEMKFDQLSRFDVVNSGITCKQSTRERAV